MKAAPFEYVRPESVAEAAAILASNEDARVIAGGQTLVPMMAMRLARPSLLVDIARIEGLAGIRDLGDTVSIGATTRQISAERSAVVRTRLPLLAAALDWVGHAATRSRGTVGGSVANADPAAEIPLVLVTLGGAVHWMSKEGEGASEARAFFSGPMSTELPQGAILTEVRFPVWSGARVGASLHEAAARRSDFAYVSAAAQVELDAGGRCVNCAIGIGAATPFPVYLEAASAALIGTNLQHGEIAAALATDIAALDIMTDHHASQDYRRRVASALAHRAVAEARDKAGAMREGAIQP